MIQYGQMEPQNQQPQQVFSPGQTTPSPQPAPLQYTSGQLGQQQNPNFSEGAVEPTQNGVISWTASEFVAHEKNGSWFAMLIAASLIIGGVVFLITREWLSLIAIAVLAAAIGVYGAVKPRELRYSLAPDGITVGDKHFAYGVFRSFAIIEDGAMVSVQLLPQKRFMVPISVYLDPTQADDIIDAIGEYLPFEHRERDLTDRLSSRFRF